METLDLFRTYHLDDTPKPPPRDSYTYQGYRYRKDGSTLHVRHIATGKTHSTIMPGAVPETLKECLYKYLYRSVRDNPNKYRTGKWFNNFLTEPQMKQLFNAIARELNESKL